MLISVTNIQRFCMHDGPGIRTTVFLKGCPLRCQWCHNPETQEIKQQIFYAQNKCIYCRACEECPQGAHKFENDCHFFLRKNCILCGKCVSACPSKALEFVSKEMSAEEILEIVKKDTAFYGEKGGMTLSGGEPMMQPEKAILLLKAAKKAGISTAVETCGHFSEIYLNDLCSFTDYFLWDIKDTDLERHKKFTGTDNHKILNNLFAADKIASSIIMRCILINSINTNKEHYTKLANIYKSLKSCRGIELIPYHVYGSSKYMLLYGKENAKKEWIPENSHIQYAKNFLTDMGCNVL